MKRLQMFGAAALALLLLMPRAAAAADGTTAEPDVPPTAYGSDRVKAKGVGITGGIVGGAEVVIAVEAAVGVDKVWPYVVFPALGAGAGGVGGYYLEKVSVPGSVALLVTSVICLIPTAIATASAFAYDPEKDGAVKADTMDDKQFSFELPNEDKELESDFEEKAVTDVEKQPDVGPPEDAAPPPETTEPPTDAPEESAPAPEDGNASPPPSASRTKSTQTVYASTHRPSGTLVHVDRKGSLSMSVPWVDVRPLAPVDAGLRADGSLRRSDRFEFHIPLLRVDLP